jgi:hypothetical protein
MVKIISWVKTDGTTVDSIKLSGCGDEEEINLTIKTSEIYSRTYPAGITKEGKEYDEFETYGMGADYHKGGETYSVWVNLTGSQKYKLIKMNMAKGMNVIAYKGKNGIDFKLGDNPDSNITTPVKQQTNLLEKSPLNITEFEKKLIETCKINNLTIDQVVLQFKGFKEQGQDIIDYNIDRIKTFY